MNKGAKYGINLLRVLCHHLITFDVFLIYMSSFETPYMSTSQTFTPFKRGGGGDFVNSKFASNFHHLG